MLQIRTNVNSRTHYDEFGSQFVAGMPKMFFRSRDTIVWQLYSDTPGLDENETPEETWTKFTGFANMTGINAYLTADNNYTHRMKGKLLSSVSGTASTITTEIQGAGFNTIPDTGTVNLFDNEGHYETVQYVSRVIEGTTVTFTADGTPTLEKSYPANSVMDAGEEVYMQATLDYQQSEVSTGLFVFNITAYSEKLRQAIVYSDVEAVPIRGLELAIFQVSDGHKQDVERYVVTTFKIMSGIAETGLDPVLPPEHINEAALMVQTLLASGLAVQYSEDGEYWVDADGTATDIPYSYFRFRLASVGGEWSAPIYLRQGERGNRITNGTAITGTSTTPTPYLTGMDDSLIGDMYINTQTQNVYLCVQDGDEEHALWVYSYCLKGEAFDKLDHETINQNSESELQAIGLKETNVNNTTKVWIGTLQQYEEQHKDEDNDVCYITDEEMALYVDSELSDSSVNPVQNRVITNALKLKKNIVEPVTTSTATTLTVEPGKAYKWNLSSNGTIAFNHSSYISKRVVVPVKLTLSNGATVTGSSTASTAVTMEGTAVSGDWEMIWDGTLATFHRAGAANDSDSIVIDTQISNSSVNPVQNKAIAAALALKADKSQLPTVDTQLSNSSVNPVQNKVVTQALALKADKSQLPTMDTQLSNSSTNPVQNKVISLALNNKLDILLPVTTSTSTSLTVEAGKAYAWTPSGNATISFNHTGLSGKHVSIPVYLTLNSGRTVSGSTSSSTAVTVNGTLETGECELVWNGSSAVFQKRKGEAGVSSYLYIAYATNSSGSGWTTTADTSHPYIAFKVSQTILTPSSSDFSGATWMKYLGSDGTRGSRINFGTAVTGTSTTPTSYATGISDSLVNDLYINTSTKNLYQCTTGGNASTAKWAFVFSLYVEESDSTVTVSSVKLDGKTLQVVSGEVDIPALPMAEDLSDSSVQDIVLYSGYEDSDSHVPGHVYQKNMIVNDSTITVSWSTHSETLNKANPTRWANTDNVLSYDSINGRWKFENDYDSGQYSSYCSDSVMPWDRRLTWYQTPTMTAVQMSFTFVSQTIEWEDKTRTNISLNGIEQIPINNVTNIAALSIAETMPTANKTAQPYILFLGTTSGSYTHGHLYKKNSTVSDSTITFSYGGATMTLIKRSSTAWSDSDQEYSLSYGSTCWVYNNGGMGMYHSPACPNTTMPWELSGQPWIFYEDNDTIYPTIPDPTTYSWTDAGTMLTVS